MATSANAYALPNPAMVDPYPIESVLAKDSASPGALLALYRADRGIANEGYQHELDAQHDQVQRQLIATMANNAAERTVGAMAHPGGVAYMASQPAFSWMGLGGNQTGLQTYTGPDQIKQMGEASKPGAEGVKALADAGYFPPTGDVSNVTGLTVNQGTAIPVQAAQARGDAQKPAGYNLPMNIGVDAQGRPVSINVQIPFGATPDETRQRTRQAIQDQVRINPGMKPNPGMDPSLFTPDSAAPPPSSPPAGTSPPPATTAQPGEYTLPPGQGETPAQSRDILRGRPVTNLTPAPQDTPPPPAATTATPAAQPTGNTTVGQIVGDASVQKQVKMLIAAKFPDAAKMDIADYMLKNKLTQIPVFPKQGGGYVILGTKGQYPMEQ